MIARFASILNFLSVPGALGAARRAPYRSMTALTMVGRMKSIGVHPTHVVDVGANRGQFSSAIVAFFPDARVTAIEPIQELQAGLQRTFSARKNVHVVCAALARTKERRIFYVNEHSHSSSFLRMTDKHLNAFPMAKECSGIELETESLDSLLHRHNIGAPDLLKLDVQGYEMEVLQGAQETLSSIQWIVLETSFAPLYQGELLFDDYHRYLSARGFYLAAPVAWLAEACTGIILQMDALYARAPRIQVRGR